jgi:hypothetical protein
MGTLTAVGEGVGDCKKKGVTRLLIYGATAIPVMPSVIAIVLTGVG